MAAVLAFALFALPARPAQAETLATFTVNDSGDGVDVSIGDGLCDADAGTAGDQCTLRAAIQEANFASSVDTIDFGFGAPTTIQFGTVLPQIVQSNTTVQNTSGQMVTLTKAPTAGNFHGIEFGNGAATFTGMALLCNNNLTITGFTGGGSTGGAGIRTQRSSITIDRCTITNSPGRGAVFVGAVGGNNIVITNNYFNNNAGQVVNTGTIHYVNTSGSPVGSLVVKGNTFDYTNQSPGSDPSPEYLFYLQGNTGDVYTVYGNYFNIVNFDRDITGFAGTPSGLAYNATHNWYGTASPATTKFYNGASSPEYLFRLGAPITSWADGSGGASLSTANGNATITQTAGTTRTAVIISHGGSDANAPFGKVNAGDPDTQCSDYFDYFLLGADGSETATVVLPTADSCDAILATNQKVFLFALAGDGSPDVACTGFACWNAFNATFNASANTMTAAGISGSDLLGTPIVGPNTSGNDPTAIFLNDLTAQGSQSALLPLAATLLLLTGAGLFVALRKRAVTIR
jgi:hypothetical protein